MSQLVVLLLLKMSFQPNIPVMCHISCVIQLGIVSYASMRSVPIFISHTSCVQCALDMDSVYARKTGQISNGKSEETSDAK